MTHHVAMLVSTNFQQSIFAMPIQMDRVVNIITISGPTVSLHVQVTLPSLVLPWMDSQSTDQELTQTPDLSGRNLTWTPVVAVKMKTEITVTMSLLISHTFFNVTEVIQAIQHHQLEMDHVVSTDPNVTIPVLKVVVDPVVAVNQPVENAEQVSTQQLPGFKNNLISMAEKVLTSKPNSV